VPAASHPVELYEEPGARKLAGRGFRQVSLRSSFLVAAISFANGGHGGWSRRMPRYLR
jgi:hypothetical protein